MSLRTLIRCGYPHMLLLAFAACALMLTPSAPETDAPVSYQHADRVITASTATDDITFIHRDAKTRSLSEILVQARIRYQRAHRRLPDESKPIEVNQPQATIAAVDDVIPLPVVRRLDTATLAAARDPFAVPYAESLVVDAPLALQAPDALPQREYVVLAYGEVADVEPIIHSHQEVSLVTRTPALFEAAVAIPSDAQPTSFDAYITQSPTAVSQMPGVTSSIPEMDAPIHAPITPAPLVESAAQPVFVSQSTRTMAETQAVEPVSIKAVSVSLAQAEQLPALAEPATRSVAKAPTAITGIEKVIAVEPGTTRDTSDVKQPDVQIKRQNLTAQTPIAQTLTTLTKPDSRQTTSVIKESSAVTIPAKRPATTTTVAEKHNDKTPSQSLVVLVDDSDTLGSDRLNAIDNALNQINQVARQAKIDLELSVTTDKSASHNILLREEDNDALGGKLGLAQSASITDDLGNEQRLGQDAADVGGKAIASLNKSVNWYAGDDGGIGKNQYDYQTAVTHELLHLLGLDDDFGSNENLAMHGYLSPGETRRAIAAVEAQELASRYASANLWRSASKAVGKIAGNQRGRIAYHAEALTAAPIPEPAGVWVIAVGLTGLWQRRRCG